MAPDLERYLALSFPPDQRVKAQQLLESATLHDGTPPGLRCQRAALVGAHGSIEALAYLVDLLKIDYRDVIVAGEYERSGTRLVKVRDLNAPIC